MPRNLLDDTSSFNKDDDLKHTARATNGFLMAKKWKIIDCLSQSLDLNPIEHAFYMLKMRLNAKRYPASMHCILHAWKGYATKYYKLLLYSTLC